MLSAPAPGGTHYWQEAACRLKHCVAIVFSAKESLFKHYTHRYDIFLALKLPDYVSSINKEPIHIP